MPDLPISLMIAGDMLISHPWMEWDHPAFQSLVHDFNAVDVAVANLETVIHEFGGYAQSDSGGAYTAAPPAVAADLARFGIAMVSAANNHSYDYGTCGVLETLRHLEAAGVASAGTGADLQSAQAPAFIGAARHRIALVAMTATFHDYNRASPSRPDMRGRPGVNPLTLTKGVHVQCPPAIHGRIASLRRARPCSHGNGVRWWGVNWTLDDGFALSVGRRIASSDHERISEPVRHARAGADLVIVSVHSHSERRWLRRWCRHLVGEGADIVFVHGNHRVAGIEVFRGKPVFYGLGDFVFQPHLIERVPAEAFLRAGLPFDASMVEYRQMTGKRGPSASRKAFEGVGARVQMSGGALRSVELVPVDLQFYAPPENRGSPRRAGAEVSRRIIADIARASRRFGTAIHYDEGSSCGVLELAGQP